ncbi:N-acetyltransferase [Gregarina niphandrodes]|uniref:N-acetyltransferase n=1 Tax=Gregarina niphandrodes TaxID=110365 RepID=A0A023B2R5_GRENI|nr:N-acetyltransferase [Gregarina niphandrodes]EZG51578.1 N-acetyltransferase [Gregarina niphandrodes]|eukprot:XP_011131938.1 N-acetyltransferase [Gregarina niphandrodes]
MEVVIRRFVAEDIYRLNETNLDSYTENFMSSFYWEFLARWPDLCRVAQALDGRIVGYILGRLDADPLEGNEPSVQRSNAQRSNAQRSNVQGSNAQGSNGEHSGADAGQQSWRGHVSALSVAPAFRNRRVAQQLMRHFEEACFAVGVHFIDLFVRASNQPAINLYSSRGYRTHKVVRGYYSNAENAHDMRLYAKDFHKTQPDHTSAQPAT